MRWRNAKIMRCNLRHQKETERRKTTHSNKQRRKGTEWEWNKDRASGEERKTNADETRRIFRARRRRHRRANRHTYICLAVCVCRCGHEKLEHFSSQSWFTVPISPAPRFPCCCCPCCFLALFHHRPLHLTFFAFGPKGSCKNKT